MRRSAFILQKKFSIKWRHLYLSVVAVGAFGSLSRRDDRLGAVMREELDASLAITNRESNSQLSSIVQSHYRDWLELNCSFGQRI